MKERGLARKKERPHSQLVMGDVKTGQVHSGEHVKTNNNLLENLL